MIFNISLKTHEFRTAVYYVAVIENFLIVRFL